MALNNIGLLKDCHFYLHHIDVADQDPAGSWFLSAPLRSADRNRMLPPGEEKISIIKSRRQGGHPANGNKQTTT